MEFLKDFALMLMTRKKYWLAPVLITLLLLSALIFFAQGASVNFIYTVF